MNAAEFKERVALYNGFDIARQKDLEQLVAKYEELETNFRNVKADLEDEQATRRQWRRRAEEAEDATNRGQFVLVLIDGDGYYFKEEFLRDASDGGGARAAYSLFSSVQQHLKSKGFSENLQIVVNVYANRAGLAQFLCEADMIQFNGQLDQFFCSFNQSQSLFNFVDCGAGKERADAKLRDTYRFYAYNAQCKAIFLACCHDNGYVAELDKYRHDPIASQKTILVHAAQAAKQYTGLQFAVTRFDDTFQTSTPKSKKSERSHSLSIPSSTIGDSDATSLASYDSTQKENAPSQPQSWSALAANGATPATLAVRPAPSMHSTSKAVNKGIPLNRHDQRVDLKLRQPTPQELNDFTDRIKRKGGKKLCNRHHLGGDCTSNPCTFDHDPIDTVMKNTLKQKARSIPCSQGPHCRTEGCYYGHHCKDGDRCSNPSCPFLKADMHYITLLEVAKYAPPEKDQAWW